MNTKINNRKKITLKVLENIRLSLYDCKYNIEEKVEIYKKYLQSLKKLAYRGNVDAQYDLAQHYEDMGVMGWPNPYHNIRKKFYWYTKAANNNHAAAYNNLADMYERGEGCTQNIPKALSLYKKAAELDDYCGKKNYHHLKKQLKKVGLFDWATGGATPAQLDELIKHLYG